MTRSPDPELPVDDILEALELPRAEPGIGYLERLFTRFNDRVPFETASKILRDREVADPADKPRWPEVFWADHLESGTGGTCFARVAAFGALLTDLKFPTRKLLGKVLSEFDHAALAVRLDGREWLCDVGFPLPALVPLAEGETETGLAAMRLSRAARGLRVELAGGVPEGPRALEIFDEAVAEESFTRRWIETFRPDSKFLTAISLRRQTESRAVSFARGELRVDDLHSRTRIPVQSSRAAALAGVFGVEKDLLARAFAFTGDPEPEISRAELTVFLAAGDEPEAAWRAIASPEGYGRLMEGAARVVASEPAGQGWSISLEPPESGAPGSGARFEETLHADPAGLSLEVRRGGQTSYYEAARKEGAAYLIRRAILPGAGEDLLRNDSLRGRLAGTLAVDLLAWARLLGKSKV